jgi:hypothetical protein
MRKRTDPRKRYSGTEPFEPVGTSGVFRGLKPRRVLTKTAYVEHRLKVGERLDTLAREYYGDPRLWWVIHQANVDVLFPADLVYRAADEDRAVEADAGRVIVIPTRPEGPA